MSTIVQSNQTDFVVTVTDAADVPINISGYGVDFLVCRRRGSAPLVALAVGTGVALTNPTAGEITASLTQAQADIVGTVYLECLTTDGSGNRKTVVQAYTTFAPTSQP